MADPGRGGSCIQATSHRMMQARRAAGARRAGFQADFRPPRAPPPPGPTQPIPTCILCAELQAAGGAGDHAEVVGAVAVAAGRRAGQGRQGRWGHRSGRQAGRHTRALWPCASSGHACCPALRQQVVHSRPATSSAPCCQPSWAAGSLEECVAVEVEVVHVCLAAHAGHVPPHPAGQGRAGQARQTGQGKAGSEPGVCKRRPSWQLSS